MAAVAAVVVCCRKRTVETEDAGIVGLTLLEQRSPDLLQTDDFLLATGVGADAEQLQYSI